MVVDSIKNYLSKEKQEQLILVIDELYLITKHLENIYPKYKSWFYLKQVEGCFKSNRNILFVRKNDKIIALSCLKKDAEKKICTIYVKKKYRRLGIGTLLFEKSMDFLETTKPFITFPKEKLTMFESFGYKYNWLLSEIENTNEYCFNKQTD